MKSPYSHSLNCAVCHQPLLMPPLGKSAGLCPGVCTMAAQLSPAQYRDLGIVVSMIARGQVTLDLEPETQVTWLAPVPPKPRAPRPCIIEDDGTLRFVAPGAPAGVTHLPGDLVVGGSDPALDSYREIDDDDGTPE